ncbi:hypothetical protein HJC23_010014 [Cyclotella cryptica]|uniref:Matrin-type domain-containing protein n=1 Tax=Cyclotella cryptica TaxID=29204 RepID=A0ABD3Q9Q0_9STRA|eukprot:CCRYP_007778-RA/>CCRYP_007778-RA protein AED:0.00 eAED:0.00 QI:436/-1/1/1/-1/1/1/227/424
MSQYKKPRWQDRTNNDRHYCPLCNAWMSSDRQSISLHENGKKHRENVEKDLKRRRDEKARKEKEEKELDSIFRKVNAVAAGVTVPSEAALHVQAGLHPQHHQQKQQTQSKPAKPKVSSFKEIKPATADTTEKSTVAAITTPDPSIGHYELEGITYLEGSTYASTVFEDNMPIQLWTGNPNASDDELRDLRNFNYWKTALLARVVRSQSSSNNHSGGIITCHISYLNNSTEDDVDEIVEKNVNPRRIRLVLGSDPSIPSTLEEARLALMGGEQTVMDAVNNTNDAPQIDENTGLSTWSTTTIRKISTQYYEQNQEKKRKEREEKETKERNEQKEREIRARRMEEAKYENAHDSALGAYDVWNRTDAGGSGSGAGSYKGVDITKDAKVEVAETAKSLAKGLGSVAFKKRKVGAKKGVRKTSADEIE